MGNFRESGGGETLSEIVTVLSSVRCGSRDLSPPSDLGVCKMSQDHLATVSAGDILKHLIHINVETGA